MSLSVSIDVARRSRQNSEARPWTSSFSVGVYSVTIAGPVGFGVLKLSAHENACPRRTSLGPLGVRAVGMSCTARLDMSETADH